MGYEFHAYTGARQTCIQGKITQPQKKKKMSKPTDQTIYTLCF